MVRICSSWTIVEVIMGGMEALVKMRLASVDYINVVAHMKANDDTILVKGKVRTTTKIIAQVEIQPAILFNQQHTLYPSYHIF